MNKLLISVGPDSANLRYATGFSAPDPVVYLAKGKKGFLLVPLLELGRAIKETNQVTVLTPENIHLDKKTHTLIEWCEGLLRYFSIDEVVVSKFFPFAVARALEEKKINVSICKESLFPDRAVKNEKEIRLIKQSQCSAVNAMRAAVQVIKESSIDGKKRLVYKQKILSSERIKEIIEKSLLAQNCGTFGTIVAGGTQATDPHEFGYGPLRADRPIVIDIFPYHRGHGYYGDITRTVIKLPPTPEQKKLYQTVLMAQEMALQLVKPGVKGSAIHAKVTEYFESTGFKTSVKKGIPQGFFHGTGHGVGLDIHESPSISSRGGILKRGHVITIEPGLYYPELGGIRIEDTVAVTSTGYDMLARCSKKFYVGR